MNPEEIAALNRAIATLFDRWQVQPETGARILDIDPDRYAAWKSGALPEIDDDLKLRLVLLLNIHVQLRALFIDHSRGHQWMNRPNALFGATPLNMLAGGDLNGLLRLQAYLAAEAQG